MSLSSSIYLLTFSRCFLLCLPFCSKYSYSSYCEKTSMLSESLTLSGTILKLNAISFSIMSSTSLSTFPFPCSGWLRTFLKYFKQMLVGSVMKTWDQMYLISGCEKKVRLVAALFSLKILAMMTLYVVYLVGWTFLILLGKRIVSTFRMLLVSSSASGRCNLLTMYLSTSLM